MNTLGQPGVVLHEPLIFGEPSAAFGFRSKLQISRVSWSHPDLGFEHHFGTKAMRKRCGLFNTRVALPTAAKANFSRTPARKAERHQSNGVHAIPWKSGQHAQRAIR